jgi:hypothetical protein
VADNLSGESKLSEVRTSSGMFISKNKVTLISVLYLFYICKFIKKKIEIIATLFLEMNMPELVLTSLNLLSPDKLSATADLFSSDLAIEIK